MSAPRLPSGEISTWGGGWRLWFRSPATLFGVVVALLVVRLAVAGGVHLTEDEGYYRLWAQAPAFGYYDHPPMIAWWIWLGVRLAGDNALGVRLLPIFASALTSLLVYDLARQAGGERPTAERAALWYNATLLVAAGGFLSVPDAPAALFWVISLSSAMRAQRKGLSVGAAWWLLAGVAAGLASLSKYSALFLGPGMLLWLISTTAGRGSLRTAGPWLALGVAAGLFGLNVAWNADHQWLTFAKQFGRVAPHRFAPRYLLEFLITELLLLNPILAVFLVRSLRGTLLVRAWPFVATSLPFIAYLLAHSLHDRIQAHWPAPVYPALAICAAFSADGSSARLSVAWRAARSAVPWFTLVVCVGAALYALLPLAGVPLRFDPALPLRGWGAFARNIEGLRRGAGAAWVGTTSYGLAAELAGESAIRAPVLQINERKRWLGLRSGDWADASRPGLLVDLPRRVDFADLHGCFAHVQRLGFVDRGPLGERPKRYVTVLVSAPRNDLVVDGCDRPDFSGARAGPSPNGVAPASQAAPPRSSSRARPGPGS